VRIVNVEAGYDVKYWEVFNEKWETTAAMHREIYRAMKAVDSTIIVGGPGWFYLDLDFLTGFTRDALPEIDFVSFHHYAVAGDTDRTDVDVYNGVRQLGRQAAQLRVNIDEVSPDRHIPIQWNEYNIHWRWRSPDPRVKTNKGAVVFALFMATAVDVGAEVSNVWNECEAPFGFMTCEGDLHVPAHVFHLFNRHMYGEQVAAASADSDAVVAYAVKTDTTWSLALINRSPQEQVAPVDFSGAYVPSDWQRHQVWEDGYSGAQAVNRSEIIDGITLPDNSVTILTCDIDSSGDTTVAVNRTGSAGSVTGNTRSLNASIDIYDLHGKRVNTTFTRSIDPGLYIIRVKDGKNSYSLKSMIF
jgi:hypothetical protein